MMKKWNFKSIFLIIATLWQSIIDLKFKYILLKFIHFNIHKYKNDDIYEEMWVIGTISDRRVIIYYMIYFVNLIV